MLLQDKATTGNGNERNLDGWGHHHTVYVEWSDGCSAGEVTIETARRCGYTGTWSVLQVVPFSDDAVDVCLINNPIGAIRARITADVVDGTVTVEVKEGDNRAP